MGDLHWKILLYVVYAIATKVTKCLWTDYNIKGDLIKKKLILKPPSLTNVKWNLTNVAK
jgi:hypothetical protein